jgi:hypothetical protein
MVVVVAAGAAPVGPVVGRRRVHGGLGCGRRPRRRSIASNATAHVARESSCARSPPSGRRHPSRQAALAHCSVISTARSDPPTHQSVASAVSRMQESDGLRWRAGARSQVVSGRDPVRVSDDPVSSAAGVSRRSRRCPHRRRADAPGRRSGDRRRGRLWCSDASRRRGADTVVQETPDSASTRDSVDVSVAAPRVHARDEWLRAVARAAPSLAVVCAGSRLGSAGGTRRPVVCVHDRVTRRSPALDTSLRVMLLDRR